MRLRFRRTHMERDVGRRLWLVLETHTVAGHNFSLDVFLQPGDVGALTFPAAGRFYHDRHRGRTHHLS